MNRQQKKTQAVHERADREENKEPASASGGIMFV
jgi:hypothetical protein